MVFHTRVLAAAAAIGCLSALVSISNAQIRGKDEGGVATLHHCDVIVGDLTGPSNYNTGTGPTSGIVRYALGTTACNIGEEPLDWYDFGTPNPTWHPVIAQNLYRLKNGRLEQIGLSWLKHAQCALQQSQCATCQAFCAGCCDELGVGCSDPYSSSMNGNPGTLGPRSQVNASTAQIMVWPYSHPLSQSSTANNNGQIHVRVEDINPALNAGAVYIAEGEYLSQDEASGDPSHRHNNASYRLVNVSSANGFPISYSGPTVREQPAIKAWQNIDPQVTLTNVDVPNDGRMIVGCRAYELGGGWWRYEYAVLNLNSDRCARSFNVPLSDCVQVRNAGFHDVNYHSGDGAVIGANYEDLDWSTLRSDGMLSWGTKTISETANANALRWGTMYNFWFEANAAPTAGSGLIELYKSGGDPAVTFAMQAPAALNPPACPANMAGGDDEVNVADLLTVISNWGNAGPLGDCAPPCGDGQINVADLLAVILTWGACP